MGEIRRPDGELLAGEELAEKQAEQLDTVTKAMQGDKEAFSLLFMQSYQAMYHVVRGFLQRDEDIYDAMQNGYAKAYKYLSRLQAPEAFFTWLKKIMENAARDVRADILGHEVSRENMAEFADELSIEYAESSERRADIQDVLEQLDPRHAEVLTLHYYDGMRLTEIAKMLHEPTTTVRSRLAAAKKAALALFREKGIDKTLYGGSVAAILTCALRNAVGSSILSAVVAQDMLDHILNGRRKDSREATALYRLLEEKRNRAIRRLASLLIVPTVSVVLAAVLLVTMIGRTAAGRLPFVPGGTASAVSSPVFFPSVESDGSAAPPVPESSLPSAPETHAPGNPSGGDISVPSGEEGCFDRALLSSTENFSAAINAAAKIHGDAVKNYTNVLDIQRHEGPSLNPATYTRLYSACGVRPMQMHEFVPESDSFDAAFLDRYREQDEWYFYNVSNESSGIAVAVNNTTGELFMRGIPRNIAVMAPWLMYLVCQVLRPDLTEAGGDIAFYAQVLNALPLQFNAGNGDGELLSEDSDDFCRERVDCYRLTREIGGYMVERYVYLASVPTYTGEDDRRNALGHIVYCATKDQYQSFGQGSYTPEKRWPLLLDENSQLRYVTTDRGSIDVNIDSRMQVDGQHRFVLSVNACEAFPEGTFPFTLTLSPYADFACFQIEQTIQLPSGEYSGTLALNKAKWENTLTVWQGIAEHHLNSGLLDAQSIQWLKQSITVAGKRDNALRQYYGADDRLGYTGVILQRDIHNGIVSEYDTDWPLDENRCFTLTDEVELYFVRD